MTCTATAATFRLLDAYAGWLPDDPRGFQGLDGREDPEGLRLALAGVDASTVEAAVVLARIPPVWLAKGCLPCEWYLAGYRRGAGTILRRRGDGAWRPLWLGGNIAAGRFRPSSVAVRGDRVAAADREAGWVGVWARRGEKVVLELAAGKPGALGFSADGVLFVHDALHPAIRRFLPDGRELPVWELPKEIASVDGLRFFADPRGVLWLAAPSGLGFSVWRREQDDADFERVRAKEFEEALTPTGLVAAAEQGFCIEELGKDGFPVVSCTSLSGCPVNAESVPRPGALRRVERGQLLTVAIDSGIPRCEWHRVRLDAEVPFGTQLQTAVATAEEKDGAKDAEADVAAAAPWASFPRGRPHPEDWQESEETDFLVRQPPGRYLFVRLRLSRSGGEDSLTPSVRRVVIDFPRKTSIESLPAIYRERPDADDFTQRFLAIFDAEIEGLDRAILRTPALLDGARAPAEVLPWLGKFFGIAFEASWPEAQRRRILAALPGLLRKRGTVAGLREAVQLALDEPEPPVVREEWAARSWGAVSRGARLGRTRLFGRASTRFRVGNSALGGAPLRSFGNPAQDPFAAGAFRLSIALPPRAGRRDPERRLRVERTVESQKPAHVIVSIREGGQGFVVGRTAVIGVDTGFGTLEPPVIGRNARLGRASVVRPGPRGRRLSLIVGHAALVGIHTLLE